MKLQEVKKLFAAGAIAAVAILPASGAVVSQASSPSDKNMTGTSGQLQSDGVFIVKDETTGVTSKITSADLYYLADKIDELDSGSSQGISDLSTSLNAKIDQEILDRQTADTSLKSDIDKEILDRQTADTSLKSDIDSKIGVLNNLQTDVKTDLVSAVNECFQDVSEGKSELVTALADINQNGDNEKITSLDSENPSWNDLCNAIRVSQVADAVADNLPTDKTAWVNGKKVIGNGKDIENAKTAGYNTGYAEGYIKGKKDADPTILNASINYRYHQHTNTDGGETVVSSLPASGAETSSTRGGCYTTPVSTPVATGTRWVPDQWGIRELLSSTWVDGQGWVRDTQRYLISAAHWETIWSWAVTAWAAACGHTTSEIVGAEIIWN